MRREGMRRHTAEEEKKKQFQVPLSFFVCHTLFYGPKEENARRIWAFFLLFRRCAVCMMRRKKHKIFVISPAQLDKWMEFLSFFSVVVAEIRIEIISAARRKTTSVYSWEWDHQLINNYTVALPANYENHFSNQWNEFSTPKLFRRWWLLLLACARRVMLFWLWFCWCASLGCHFHIHIFFATKQTWERVEADEQWGKEEERRTARQPSTTDNHSREKLNLPQFSFILFHFFPSSFAPVSGCWFSCNSAVCFIFAHRPPTHCNMPPTRPPHPPLLVVPKRQNKITTHTTGSPARLWKQQQSIVSTI